MGDSDGKLQDVIDAVKPTEFGEVTAIPWVWVVEFKKLERANDGR